MKGQVRTSMCAGGGGGRCYVEVLQQAEHAKKQAWTYGKKKAKKKKKKGVE